MNWKEARQEARKRFILLAYILRWLLLQWRWKKVTVRISKAASVRVQSFCEPCVKSSGRLSGSKKRPPFRPQCERIKCHMVNTWSASQWHSCVLEKSEKKLSLSPSPNFVTKRLGKGSRNVGRASHVATHEVRRCCKACHCYGSSHHITWLWIQHPSFILCAHGMVSNAIIIAVISISRRNWVVKSLWSTWGERDTNRSPETHINMRKSHLLQKGFCLWKKREWKSNMLHMQW